jgi:hypothetical protein
MAFAVLIYLLVFLLIIVSVKVFYFTITDGKIMLENNAVLQKQLHSELLKQENINQKLKLVVDLNQTLKHNIFKLFKDMMAFNKLVLKNN